MNEDIINKCEIVFSFDEKNKKKLISFLKSGRLNDARILIEEIEEELIDSILVKLEPGERYIHNAKIETLKQINDIYSVIQEEILNNEHEEWKRRMFQS
jgi:hypothetical protein